MVSPRNPMTIGALSVCSTGDAAGARRAASALAQQGFRSSLQHAWEDLTLQVWTDSHSDPVVHSVSLDVGMAACVGPLWYRGRFGEAALRLLLEDASGVRIDIESAAEQGASFSDRPGSPSVDETQLRGNFALFLRVGNRCWLLNDALGFVRIHCSADFRFFSTSWLAARAYVGDSGIDESAAVEYVLLGASHSNRTVARGVDTLALGFGVDLAARRTYSRFEAGIVPTAEGRSRFASIDEAVDAVGEHLRTVFREIVEAFPGRTSAALSGGFDSRLILAGLLAEGESPRLFVYGDPGSEDVPIARQVAQAAGIPLNVVDKGASNQRLPQPGLDDLVRNALFFDGLPNDGIDDPGIDRSTRLEQSADGFIALNGGGGEIFRNFFHLADRAYRPLDIVRAFYRGFDAGVFRHAGGLSSYERTLARSIAESIGLPPVDESADRRVERERIELIYPFFRCHYWMGLNNSLSTRIGYFMTPLVDLELVRQSFDIPLAWKHAGEFESRLIAALHPGVAREQSAYGFRFIDGPDARARRSETLMGLRPVRARPLIGALRRRLYKDRVSSELVSRCRDMLPGEWQLDPLLDLSRLPADGAFERAMAIEVVSRELSP